MTGRRLVPTNYHQKILEIEQRTIDTAEIPLFQCAGCGIWFSFSQATLDHIFPRCRGGANHPDNYQNMCGPCNSSKGGRTMEEWVKSGNVRCKNFWKGRHDQIPKGFKNPNFVEVTYIEVDKSRINETVVLCDGKVGVIAEVRPYGFKVNLFDRTARLVTDEEIKQVIFSADLGRQVNRLPKPVFVEPKFSRNLENLERKAFVAPQFGRRARTKRLAKISADS